MSSVHNAERFLRETVTSVLAQTFSDFELLAFDDGSTDNSLSILNDFAARDSRVVVRSEPGRGIVPVLNDLIAASRGTYLARMDADDICATERFEKQVAHLNANPDCTAVSSRVLLIDESGAPISSFFQVTEHEQIDREHMTGGTGQISHPASMLRKNALLRIGGYKERFRFAEDLDLFLRLGEIGTLASLPEALLKYRLHHGSVCFTRADIQRRSARMAIEEACIRRGVDPPSLGPMQPQNRVDEIHRKWAWWALHAGNVRTARKHARPAFFKRPLSIDNARVLACAVRGR